MKVLIGRTFHGAGDWYMLARVLLMFRKHRPDIQIHLLRYPQTPEYLLDVVLKCVPGITVVNSDTVIPASLDMWYLWYRSDFCPAGYDCCIAHVVYPSLHPSDGEHLMAGMLRVMNERLDTRVPYDLSCCAVPTPPESAGTYPDRFMLVPSCGAQTDSSQPKEFPHMQELASRLATLMPVIQIGLPGDPPLKGASGFFTGRSPAAMFDLFRRATYGVFIENGLAHWAGNCGLCHSTLFCSKHFPEPRVVAYPTTHPVEAYTASAENVFYQIKFQIGL